MYDLWELCTQTLYLFITTTMLESWNWRWPVGHNVTNINQLYPIILRLICIPFQSPGQYFLRPMMKEYKFDPVSRMIDVLEGSTVNVKISSTRIAFRYLLNFIDHVINNNPLIVFKWDNFFVFTLLNFVDFRTIFHWYKIYCSYLKNKKW